MNINPSNPKPEPRPEPDAYCCKCGAGLTGLQLGKMVRCPRCRNVMRHVGGPFCEYVSPLDVSPSPIIH